MRQLDVIPFLEDQLVMICNPDHPLGKKKSVEIKDLGEEKFIGFDQDIPTRKATDQMFRDNKVDLVPVMEFDNIETVKRAVEINAGISIVPSATVKQEMKQGLLKAITIKGSEVTRPLAIIHRKGRVLTPAMKKFITTLTGKPYQDVLDVSEKPAKKAKS
jgi:DNA-binding transcriptional LysR family regulator